jgi:hypothetical protein
LDSLPKISLKISRTTCPVRKINSFEIRQIIINLGFKNDLCGIARHGLPISFGFALEEIYILEVGKRLRIVFVPHESDISLAGEQVGQGFSSVGVFDSD